jgi:hypothetical protein
MLGLHVVNAQQPTQPVKSIADQVEKKVYFQKPADKPEGGVVQTQAVAPPAPPPLFNTQVQPQPLLIPPNQLPTPAPIRPVVQPTTPITPNLQLAEIQETKPFGLGNPAGQSNGSTTQPMQPTPVQPVPNNPTPAQTQPGMGSTSGSLTGNDNFVNAYAHVPPKREDVFRFDNDAVLKNRIKNEIKQFQATKIEVLIPEYKDPTNEAYKPRAMPEMQVKIEPAYVMHRRLFFEQKNTERAGWDLGLAQPILCATSFYKDCFLFPHKLATNFLEPYDTSAGKCLPGSPTPLLFYPPEFSMFGGTVGTAVIIGTAAILP